MSGSRVRVVPTHDFSRTLVGTVRDLQARDPNLMVLEVPDTTTTGLPGVLRSLADDTAADSPPLPRALGLVLAGRRVLIDATGTQLGPLVTDVETLASLRYRTGGVATAPILILARIGGPTSGCFERAQWGALCRIAGLKVAVPVTTLDLDDMVRSAMRERGPVMLLLDSDLLGPPWGALHPQPAAAREQTATQALVRARVVLPGDEVTLVTAGSGVDLSRQALRRMRARAGVELIDLRVLAPWDRDTVLTSVEKTGRLVVVDEDGHGFGLAAEIMASVAEVYPPILQAPPQRVTRAEVPIATVEHLITPTLPTAKAIGAAINRVMAIAPRQAAEPA